MTNTGLEALATIAAAGPSPEIASCDTKGEKNVTQNLQNQNSAGRSSVAPGTTSASKSANNDQGTQNAPVPAPSSNMNTPQSTAAQQNNALALQLQQVLASATASNPAQSALTANNLALLGGMQQLAQPDQPSLAPLQQQLAYYQYLMQGQASNQGVPVQSGLQIGQAAVANNGLLDPSKATSLILAAQQLAAARSSVDGGGTAAGQQQALSGGNPAGGAQGPNPPPAPPKGTLGRPISVSTVDAKMPTTTSSSNSIPQATIALQPGTGCEDARTVYESHLEGKKLQKRAANRRSAQLSRKRKKQLMEELKEENDELRRKEQILKSIPDLVVVFDSTGKLWFVSESVSKFLKYSADELVGTSFWDRLCQDSVRLLKAAFMDSLAERQADSDCASLGAGFWELRLVDRNGDHKVVTLNGVVHFAGDRPECVCSIRPGAYHAVQPDLKNARKTQEMTDNHHRSLIRIKPQQSVVSNGSSDSSTSHGHKTHRARHGKSRAAVRISSSDTGISSGESETASGSGSSDELNGATSSS